MADTAAMMKKLDQMAFNMLAGVRETRLVTHDVLLFHAFVMSMKAVPLVPVRVEEVEWSAVRSQGAGGQNVNKVATALHLRFDIGGSSLPEKIRNGCSRSGTSASPRKASS